MNPVKVILAIICFVVALYNFDFYDLNRTIVAILLLMQAILLVSHHKKLNRFLVNTSVFLAIFLIFKILIGG